MFLGDSGDALFGAFLQKSLATGLDLTQGIKCKILRFAQRAVENDSIIHPCMCTPTPKNLQANTTLWSFSWRTQEAGAKASPEL